MSTSYTIHQNLPTVIKSFEDFVDQGLRYKDSGEEMNAVLFALLGRLPNGQRVDIDPYLNRHRSIEVLRTATVMRDLDSFFGYTRNLPYKKEIDVFLAAPSSHTLTQDNHMTYKIVRQSILLVRLAGSLDHRRT